MPEDGGQVIGIDREEGDWRSGTKRVHLGQMGEIKIPFVFVVVRRRSFVKSMSVDDKRSQR